MSDSIFLTDGNGTITGLVAGTSYAEELIIPEYVAEERITAIGVEAFHECEFITAVTIPDSVTSIDYDAFCCCYKLTSINIPSSVTSIGLDAFYNCAALTTVYVDDPNNLSEAVAAYDWSTTGSSGITFMKAPSVIPVNNLVVNKLTLNQYKTAKNDGLADDELYIVTDLDRVVDSTIAAAVQASMEIIFSNIPTVEGGIF